MAFDTIIRGGTIATAADTFSCDVGIKDGVIAALVENAPLSIANSKTILEEFAKASGAADR